MRHSRLAGSPTKLTGTFDFRWPHGSTIRVAFQSYANTKAFELGIKRVTEAFEAWGVYSSLRSGGPALCYAIVADDFPAGGKVTQELLDTENARARQQIAAATASPETAEQLAHDAGRFAEVAKKAKLAKASPDALAAFGAQAFEYDVLISFAPMPLVVPGSDHLENAARALVYAQSDLGAYAKREDLGLPTTFLGRPEVFPADGASSDPDLSWLASPQGKFTILHEIGHVLGLAHEHQNPKRGLVNWRSPEEILAMVKLRGMEPVYEDFFHLELTGAFPLLPGAEAFSQWREPTNAERAGGLIESVMIEPLYRCVLRDREPAHHDCLNLRSCPFEQQAYEKFQHPTDSDRQQLKQLYPSK